MTALPVISGREVVKALGEPDSESSDNVEVMPGLRRE